MLKLKDYSFLIGFILMQIISKIDYHLYKKNANKILLVCLILLILVLILVLVLEM